MDKDDLENCNTFSDKSTPILYGEDAKRFLRVIKKNKNKKVDLIELEKIKEGAELLNKILIKSKKQD